MKYIKILIQQLMNIISCVHSVAVTVKIQV